MLAKVLATILVAAGLAATTTVVYKELSREADPITISPGAAPSPGESTGCCIRGNSSGTPVSTASPNCCGD